MPPRVSVIVPTFDRREWLPESIASVRAQTMADWELILVDDGSSDGTEHWARALRESRLRFVRRDHTGSIGGTRNAGIDEARGAWVAFLDSDDRWRADKLARQLARLHDVAHARWCYSGYQMMTAEGVFGPQPSGGPWQPFEGWIADRLLTTEATVLTPTLLLSADLARGLRFDAGMPLAEDYDFVLRLATTAPGCVVDEALADIRMHPGRTTSRAGLYDGYLGKVIAYRKASRLMPDPRLRRIARRQLYSHLGTFLRRATRHGAMGQVARVAAALVRA
jgi:glycosyltransferase involved in cell wall biosynthesis